MTACPSTSGRHDRATDYTNHGCRCPAARADRERRRKRGHLDGPLHIPAIGARRRLRALMRIGWSQNDINERLGRARSGSLGPLLWTDRPTVHVDVDRRIRTVFDQLWQTPGPSKVTARRAAARGWPPPLFWADTRVDDPTYLGEKDFHEDLTNENLNPTQTAPRSLRLAEHMPLVADLSAKGLSARQIAAHLDCSARRVVRLRAQFRATTHPDVSDRSSSVAGMDERQVAS